MPPQSEFLFTEEDFIYLKGLIVRLTGIDLSPYKKQFLYSRIARRLRELELTSFADYCKILKSGDETELKLFKNAVTTNLTFFFREDFHFEYLKQHIEILKRSKNFIKIWSAGCSTGEEPYSLAIVIKEALKSSSNVQAKILATDIDSTVLAAAKAGVYTIDALKNVDPSRQKTWFLKGVDENEGTVIVKPELQDLVEFKEHNLLESHWNFEGSFDVIFCRNVLIYFTLATKQRLIDRFAEKLNDNGLLILGYSENLFQVSNRFELLMKSIYKKK